MKISKKKSNTTGVGINRPRANQARKLLLLLLIIGITAGLIMWVMQIGEQAERTVTIVMIAKPVYKNQVITEDLLKPYDILEGEFEKYVVVDSNGQKKRRLILWEERNQILNSFAAYPLQKDTYAEYRSFIKRRVDNTDNVLYSFPGKELVPLEIARGELDAFKTFLKPGDRLNIQAIFTEKVTVPESDGFGGTVNNTVEIYQSETVFGDIMIADLLNSKGESILDIYSNYERLSIWDQAKLEATQSFQERTTPATLLLALTPEEKERYYFYLSKSNVKFKVSMPQRIE
mgnify:FL=1